MSDHWRTETLAAIEQGIDTISALAAALGVPYKTARRRELELEWSGLVEARGNHPKRLRARPRCAHFVAADRRCKTCEPPELPASRADRERILSPPGARPPPLPRETGAAVRQLLSELEELGAAGGG